ncbi:MAG: DUF1329 domain-containing protein, partial [Deltaproteobacteria bacterium]|nr:DUF1329 domain-containing protein [Deltaproteobacteria bacterium]
MLTTQVKKSNATRTCFYGFLILLAQWLSGAAMADVDERQSEGFPAGFPFSQGDVVGYDELTQIQEYLPEEIWDNRDLVFFKGMQMQMGPPFRDYRPAEAYQNATETFRGQPRLGLDGSLENYTAGQPFPMEDIDCLNDPDAGTKIMWNFDYQWEGDGANAHFLYTYWDRGEKLPLYYQGYSKVMQLSHRVEPEYLKKGGDLLRRERRKYAFNIMVEAPFDSRGIHVLTFRHKTSDNDLASADDDDTWVYIPTMHRTRRISAAQRTQSIQGTDFTLDDMASFGGVVPQYNWTCLGDVEILAPTNTIHEA